jgi:ABC-type transport system, involved in lipoprotein release, permease component
MNKASFLLAMRYMRASSHQSTISTMTLICFISIMVGSFALALVTAIMNGFEYTVHEKMQGIHSHAIIRSADNLNYDAISAVISQEFPEIRATSPSIIEHAIIRADNDDHTPVVVMLRAIDPSQEMLVSHLHNKMKNNTSLLHALADNQIIIGKGLADQLGLTIGMPLQLMHLEYPSKSSRKVTVNHTETVVGGIIQTGIDEYDTGLVLTSIPFIQSIFPASGFSQISLSFAPGTQQELVIARLKQRLALDVYSWKDLYPALVSALKLEKYAMFFILLLITLVASMNIIALLFMIITQKKSDIAILQALGMHQSAITSIFMIIGIIITMSATIAGLICASLVSWLFETYPFIELPDAYYTSHLPARMEWIIIIVVFTTVLLISIITSWLSARRTHGINISNVLRFEG